MLFDGFGAGASRRTRRSTRSSRSAWSSPGPRTTCARAADRARGGRAGAAARRRHVAVRPDRRPRAGHRLRKHLNGMRRVRSDEAHAHGRARHRARRAERASSRDGPVVSGRRLDRQPRHHRRHGRQQLVRHALDPLRHHARQRARHRRDAGRRQRSAVRREVRRQLSTGATLPRRRAARATCSAATCSRSETRGRRDRARVPRRCCAARRRLQHRRARPRPDQRRQSRHLLVGSEGTLAFFTRLELKLSPMPPQQGARHLPFPDLLPGDGGDPAHRQARTRARSSWSTAR